MGKSNGTNQKKGVNQSVIVDGSGNVVTTAGGNIQQTLNDSMNIIDKSNVSKELSACLKELTENVNKIITLLPADKQTVIAENLKGIAETAANEKKDKNKLNRFVEPFVNTVKTIGDVGIPLISLVTKIVGLF